MFRFHPDQMRMEPTPERVYAVCRMVARQAVSKEELVQIMTLGEDHPDVGKALSVALDDLHMVDLIDGKLTLAVPKETVVSPVSFRQFVSSIAFRNDDSTFSRFTKWFLAQNERVFTLGKWEVLATTARSESSSLEGLGENDVLGWRFWAAFLGIGYLSGTILIPNMTIRIRDVLSVAFTKSFSFDTPVRAQDFLSWIAFEIPEADCSQDTLQLGFSAGLRTLHELKLIELQTQRDTDLVHLYHVDGDPNNTFSHIVVREVIKQ